MAEPKMEPGDKSVRVYIGTVDVLEGSAASLYLIAKEYRQAVHDIAAADGGERLRNHMFRPLFHNAEQCIELLLKAFNLQNGIPAGQLKDLNVRHNLEALLNLSIGKGLSLDPSMKTEIIEAASLTSTHFFRYGGSPAASAAGTTAIVLPNPVVMISAIEALGPQVATAVGLAWP